MNQDSMQLTGEPTGSVLLAVSLCTGTCQASGLKRSMWDIQSPISLLPFHMYHSLTHSLSISHSLSLSLSLSLALFLALALTVVKPSDSLTAALPPPFHFLYGETEMWHRGGGGTIYIYIYICIYNIIYTYTIIYIYIYIYIYMYACIWLEGQGAASHGCYRPHGCGKTVQHILVPWGMLQHAPAFEVRLREQN